MKRRQFIQHLGLPLMAESVALGSTGSYSLSGEPFGTHHADEPE